MTIILEPKQIEFLQAILKSWYYKGKDSKNRIKTNKIKNSILKSLNNEVVYIRPVSKFQKDDCLFCSEPSTAEAIYKTSQIRCCIKCIAKAKTLAKQLSKINMKHF